MMSPAMILCQISRGRSQLVELRFDPIGRFLVLRFVLAFDGAEIVVNAFLVVIIGIDNLVGKLPYLSMERPNMREASAKAATLD